jgi:hypothetical protein
MVKEFFKKIILLLHAHSVKYQTQLLIHLLSLSHNTLEALSPVPTLSHPALCPCLLNRTYLSI